MSALVGHAFHGAPVAVNVAASQTAAELTERAKTFIYGLLIQPLTTSPGVVTLYDGDGTGEVTRYHFPGGASSVADLKPFYVPLGITSINQVGTLSNEGWHIDTGANVSVIAFVQVR